jgi:hypothetical protein
MADVGRWRYRMQAAVKQRVPGVSVVDRVLLNRDMAGHWVEQMGGVQGVASREVVPVVRVFAIPLDTVSVAVADAGIGVGEWDVVVAGG